MQYAQTNKPTKLNLDKSLKYLGLEESFYLLNHDVLSNKLGKSIPFAANFPMCDIDKPAGENYTMGAFRSPLTKEIYSWHYNSNGVHYIQRINSDGTCQIVYYGCLSLDADPENAIKQWRCYMKIDKLCANIDGKQLIWTYGIGPIYQLDVEASIKTSFYTTDFFKNCTDPCDLIRMCVPDPCDCIKAEWVAPVASDAGLTNNMVNSAYKFSYQHTYYDERASIWADPSTAFYQDSKGCFDNTDTFSRCIKLRVPVGNPLVDRINIGFQKDGVWYLAETIYKYKKYTDDQQFWYERELSEDITGNNYSDQDCSFDYIFCNDKQCDPIDPIQFNRVFNPIPRDVQSLMPVGLNGQDIPALGAVNYKQGNCPLDQKEAQKFNIAIDCSGKQTCNTEYATITVRAIVHDFDHDRNQFIYRLGGTAANSPDDTGDTAYFGGLDPALDGGFQTGYDQTFNETTRNFIAYAEGTDYWGEMKQWKAHQGFVQLEQWGTIGNMNDVNNRNRWRRAARNGEFFYQELKLKVLKGTRGFLRLTSHHSTGNDQSKSTFVKGIINNIVNYYGDIDKAGLDDILNYGTQEIYFDTCNGDIDLKPTFLIQDNAVSQDNIGQNDSSAYHGYIIDNNSSPVEGALIQVDGSVVDTTDHNGFYHFYLNPGTNDAKDLIIMVERNCNDNFNQIALVSVQSGPGSNTEHDYKITDATWTNSFYANVNLAVRDCNGNPVGGIRVAISGSKFQATGADGVARFKIRNYVNRNRIVKAVVLNQKGCIVTDCNGNCNPCMPVTSSSTPACYFSLPTIILSPATIDLSSVNERGLKPGGRFPFGFYVRFGCGKISAVYESGYIDIPRVQEIGEGFCGFKYSGNGIMLPSDAQCLVIVRGENVNSFELQWIVDEIDRTDDGKIKLTIQSLNDYNAKFFFKTNTIYQWLAGDRVEFIKNGDGTILTIGQYGLLNYLTISPFHDSQISGQTNPPTGYFNQLIIEDDGKLDNITAGAVIEIQRVKTCTTLPTYFSICVSIPVVDGQLVYPDGTFNTFDTFYVDRVIDVPPNLDVNGVPVNQGSFPITRFQHFAPSDFWGAIINDTGRVSLDDTGRSYFVDKYENEKRYGRNISINAPNQYNYFGDLVKIFNQSLHGDVVAVKLVDDKIGLLISEHDNSLFEVGNDLLQVGGDGIVRALSANQVISDPQAKLFGAYGCNYGFAGSIFMGDGFTSWWDDDRGHLVIHNGKFAEAIDIQQFQSYFRKRSTEIQQWNKSHSDPLDKLRICTGMNYNTGAIYVTVKSLRNSGIYNELAPMLKPNETFSFHPLEKAFLTFTSFTPEEYGFIEDNDCAFITYLNGIPYMHPINPQKYNEFYGIACDWIVGVSINEGPKKRKNALALEVQSGKIWFAKNVTTDDGEFISEIPPIRWKQSKGRINASFLGNINSRGGLYGDNKPFGYFITALLVRDNTDNLKYGTIDNNKRVEYSELDEIISKFKLVEQTGFEGNV